MHADHGTDRGLSWVATADYYRRLTEITNARLGGAHSAALVLASVDREPYVEAVIRRRAEAAAGAIILEAARRVERAGAEFIVICCNDVHRFVPGLAPQLSIPFLHIAEATAAAVAAAGLGRVGLLGVRKTMEGDLYPAILAARGIAALVPGEPDRAWVHDSI